MSLWNTLTGRQARTVAGGALVVDGLIGGDTPGRKRGGLPARHPPPARARLSSVRSWAACGPAAPATSVSASR